VTDPYDLFAAYYDAVNEEPEERIALVLSVIERYHPGASAVLELGCGTGAVLAGLGSGYALTGVDRSGGMLDVARRRVPSATLVRDDITTVDLHRSFDVVLCVCDTINHLTEWDQWRDVVATAAAHCAPGGLFILDVNTRGRFLELSESTPWAHDVDGNTLVMSVTFDDPLATWHLRLFERVDEDTFHLRHAEIAERCVATADVVALVATYFDVLETSDTEGGEANDVSHRGVVVARRR
jgi:SAM-dependent methyltransferase